LCKQLTVGIFTFYLSQREITRVRARHMCAPTYLSFVSINSMPSLSTY
jgi:hypothetical protein